MKIEIVPAHDTRVSGRLVEKVLLINGEEVIKDKAINKIKEKLNKIIDGWFKE